MREIIPEQRDLIVRIFQMYASDLGCPAIAQSLNKEQIPSPGALLGWSGKSWNANTMSCFLKNTTYVGTPTWNKKKQYRAFSMHVPCPYGANGTRQPRRLQR